ncbi:phage Gp37/Gp68 family protein [Trinickia violacea]|uniref:Phage Gp37/Gp68 family protein n=1 Tax=Trinickia violacea TaxID=2571746 RepID=A0A4P8IMK1_9BURK|nr:phage Gp37/Gp68 family protein [Trinickia violacea]QCP50192.1 phage Gp37/Gp68 family protein [Trinickia violacea]
MSENSKIEWTDHTFNPWEGCQKVGPGCDHCYAEARNARFSGGMAANWGQGAPRRRTSEANWKQPLRWNAQPYVECMACRWRGERRECAVVQNPAGFDAPVDQACVCPRCGEPTIQEARQRVFCASLADVFDNAVPDAWRADLFDLIWKTPHLDWLLLTKRIGNVGQVITRALELAGRGINTPWPWSNVWLGATIVNQEEANRDIPKLLITPARVRFLSMEPLLGPVDLERPMPGPDLDQGSGAKICQPWMIQSGINWVIVGGESGHGARPMHPEWARSLRDQCAAAGVPFLFKQWGEWTPGENVERHAGIVKTADWFGGEWMVGESDLASDGGHIDDEPDLYRVGKKEAGRHLDGRTHDEFPEAR